jgi:tRNA threonylcarbamoyladenosine biosynthesis protein TsaE
MQKISHSIADTLKIGRLIAGNLKKGQIICLFGQLGSGKTVLTKGIACGLGIKKEEIISPSFVLIREYPQGKLPFYHFDLYRLKNPQDILLLGYQDYLNGEGVTVIEWADRLKYLEPAEFLKIELCVKNKSRRLLKFTAFGRQHKMLLEKIKRSLAL